MSWCQDDFPYQWNSFKADLLGLGALLISSAPIPSCLWIHYIQGTGPISSHSPLRLPLPCQYSFFSVHIPSSCGRWWCQEAGGFQHPRLAGPCWDQLSAFTIWQEENGNKIRPKAKAVLCWSLWSYRFLNTKVSDPELPFLKINLKTKLFSLCYLRTFYHMQHHLLF